MPTFFVREQPDRFGKIFISFSQPIPEYLPGLHWDRHNPVLVTLAPLYHDPAMTLAQVQVVHPQGYGLTHAQAAGQQQPDQGQVAGLSPAFCFPQETVLLPALQGLRSNFLFGHLAREGRQPVYVSGFFGPVEPPAHAHLMFILCPTEQGVSIKSLFLLSQV
jgi:hypothetical protein